MSKNLCVLCDSEVENGVGLCRDCNVGSQSGVKFGSDVEEAIWTGEETIPNFVRESQILGEKNILSAEEESELANYIEAGIWAIVLSQEFETSVGPKNVFCSACGKVAHQYIEPELEGSDVPVARIICKPCLDQMIELGEKKREILVQAHIPLVWELAMRLVGNGVWLSQLFEAGFRGLSRAIEVFDFNEKTRFSRYVRWYAWREMQENLSNNSGVMHIPVHIVEAAQDYEKVFYYYVTNYGREPSLAEYAAELSRTVEQVLYLQTSMAKVRREAITMNAEAREKMVKAIESVRLVDPEDESAVDEFRRRMYSNDSALSPVEYLIIEKIYGFEFSQENFIEEIIPLVPQDNEIIDRLMREAKLKIDLVP